MEHRRSFLNQIVASTGLDGHGEKRDKQFFEALIASYPPRMPLHQQHDMRKRTLGYLENWRLVKDHNNQGEWLVIADVFIDSDDIDEALRGFSFSSVEPMNGNLEGYSMLFSSLIHITETKFLSKSFFQMTTNLWLGDGSRSL